MKRLFMRFIRDENGQSLVEYGLILALVVIAAIVIMRSLGDEVRGTFTDVVNTLSGRSSTR